MLVSAWARGRSHVTVNCPTRAKHTAHCHSIPFTPQEDRPFVPAVLAEMCQDRTMECRSDKRLLPMTRALQIMPLSHIMNLAPLDGSHSYFHVPKRVSGWRGGGGGDSNSGREGWPDWDSTGERL